VKLFIAASKKYSRMASEIRKHYLVLAMDCGPKKKKKEWNSLPFLSSPDKKIVVFGPESCIRVSSRSTTAPSL